MNKDQLARRNTALKSAWTPEKRAAASAFRKAHPQGNRDPRWWDAHPEAKLKLLERIAAAYERKLREPGG